MVFIPQHSILLNTSYLSVSITCIYNFLKYLKVTKQIHPTILIISKFYNSPYDYSDQEVPVHIFSRKRKSVFGLIALLNNYNSCHETRP